MASDPNSFDTSYAGAGATAGSAFGPLGTAIGAAAGLGIGGVKYLLGSAQRKAANAIHPYNPGYEINRDTVDNARILGDNYNNYLLPGYKQTLSNLQSGQTNAQVNAERGATSSGDVISAANVGNQVNAQQMGQLAVQNAQGKQNALTEYLAAKAASGAEQQNKNTYDREMYNQQLGLKNQLNNNATANQYGAADQAAKLISSIFSYKGGVKSPVNKGAINPGVSIFSGDE